MSRYESTPLPTNSPEDQLHSLKRHINPTPQEDISRKLSSHTEEPFSSEIPTIPENLNKEMNMDRLQYMRVFTEEEKRKLMKEYDKDKNPEIFPPENQNQESQKDDGRGIEVRKHTISEAERRKAQVQFELDAINSLSPNIPHHESDSPLNPSFSQETASPPLSKESSSPKQSFFEKIRGLFRGNVTKKEEGGNENIEIKEPDEINPSPNKKNVSENFSPKVDVPISDVTPEKRTPLSEETLEKITRFCSKLNERDSILESIATGNSIMMKNGEEFPPSTRNEFMKELLQRNPQALFSGLKEKNPHWIKMAGMLDTVNELIGDIAKNNDTAEAFALSVSEILDDEKKQELAKKLMENQTTQGIVGFQRVIKAFHFSNTHSIAEEYVKRYIHYTTGRQIHSEKDFTDEDSKFVKDIERGLNR